MGAPTKKNGFTLMELMMTLAVVAVIFAIAIPNFRDFLLNSRMTGAANDLLGGIQLARSEAIKRQVPVAICASADPTASPPACVNQFSGWLVWVDTDNDGVVDANEDIVRRNEPLSTHTMVSTGGGLVSFGRDGFAQDPVAGTPLTRFVLICDERDDAVVGDSYRKRVLLLSRTGRPGVLRTTAEFANHAPEFVDIGANPDCP